MSTYANVATLEAELLLDRPGESLTDSARDALHRIVEACSRHIDNIKGVEAGAYSAGGNAAAQRMVRATLPDILMFPPALSVSAVGLVGSDGVAAALSDWWALWPYDTATTGEPYRAAVPKPWLVGTQRFIVGQMYAVTGVWGVTVDVPEPIRQACHITAVRWYRRAQNAWTDSTVNPIDGGLNYVQSLDPDVVALLQRVYPHRGRP